MHDPCLNKRKNGQKPVMWKRGEQREAMGARERFASLTVGLYDGRGGGLVIGSEGGAAGLLRALEAVPIGGKYARRNSNNWLPLLGLVSNSLPLANGTTLL